MSLETLKHLRFFIPGIVIFLFWALLGKFTGDWKVQTSLTAEEIGKTMYAVVFGLIYYASPLRNLANRRNYEDVNTNIKNALVEMGGGDPEIEKSSWPKIRRLFYSIVNSDDSLTVQSKIAYFNGLIWTSVADVKALSIFFSIISFLYHFAFDSQGALIGVAVFGVVAVATWPLSKVITEKHKNISNEQISIIRDFHSHKIKEYFEDE